jgi:GGDEF domain-containing protein
MLSTALSQLLERARTRFGLEVEILDAELQHVYPESGGDLGRLIEESPAVRRALLDALAAGRPENLNRGGMNYRVFPLRRSARLRNGSGLMAIRGSAQAESLNMEPWSDLARAVVEADFAAADALSDERQNSRRLLATLRFLRHLVDTDTEADLSEAVVQAAAVWFDADARIYERDLAGDYVLHTALPGAEVEEAGRRLNSLCLPGSNEVTRLRGVPEGWQSAAGSEVVLVPLWGGGPPEWVLALIGDIPQDAEAVFPILGRVVGVQLEAMRARRRDRVRDRVESLLAATGRPQDATAAQVVGELVHSTGASSAALALNRDGRWRRLVSLGSIAPAPSTEGGVQPDWLFTSDQFVCEFQLDAGVRAVLELRPDPGKIFTPDAALVTRVTAGLLQVWLRAAEPLLLAKPAQPGQPARPAEPLSREAMTPVMSAFLRRLDEELERAKRFDLRLSLVLIDVTWQMPGEGEAVTQLQEALRRELRGSDVLGKMNGQRVAALLTHTDAPGSHKVVGRVRRRMAEAARQLNLGGITIGHAAFSPDCLTAEALVSQAMRDAEPVAV